MANNGLRQHWRVYVLTIFVAATVVACGPRDQKRKAPPPEAAAPITILGITIDKPLALPACKKSDLELLGGPAWEALYHGSTTCYVEITLSKKEEAEITKTVDPVFRDRKTYRIYIPTASEPFYISKVTLSTLHSKVAEVVVDTMGADTQDLAFSDLKAKFGNPSDAKSNTLQNGFGAQFASINASWLLAPQNVTVEFEGITSTRDTGRITIHSQAFTEADNEYWARHPSPHL